MRGDITQEKVDAIINAANSTLLGGGGVDGAIHRAAGEQLLMACRRLRSGQASEAVTSSGVSFQGLRQGLPVGQAVATPGFGLPARWVIHTVGPNRHREQSDPTLLASCFTSSLEVAQLLGAESVAFPAVSAGVYGWDGAEVARVGLRAVQNWEGEVVSLVRFVLFSSEMANTWRSELG